MQLLHLLGKGEDVESADIVHRHHKVELLATAHKVELNRLENEVRGTDAFELL